MNSGNINNASFIKQVQKLKDLQSKVESLFFSHSNDSFTITVNGKRDIVSIVSKNQVNKQMCDEICDLIKLAQTKSEREMLNSVKNDILKDIDEDINSTTKINE
jgi:hypothetical protein